MSIAFTGTVTYTARPSYYKSMPKQHRVYRYIGRLVTEAARFEHILDVMIWALVGADQHRLACVTAQFAGPYSRFKAIKSLCRYLNLGAGIVKQINKLSEDSRPATEYRNRIVHDPWYVDADSGNPAQYKKMASDDLRLELVTISVTDIEKKTAKVTAFAKEAIKLLDEISHAIDTLHGKSQSPAAVHPRSAPLGRGRSPKGTTNPRRSSRV
jgi:hypothetical protein